LNIKGISVQMGPESLTEQFLMNGIRARRVRIRSRAITPSPGAATASDPAITEDIHRRNAQASALLAS
jgi:hypothetical protein